TASRSISPRSRSCRTRPPACVARAIASVPGAVYHRGSARLVGETRARISSPRSSAMSHESSAYRQLRARWARGEPAVMDGVIGSELQAMGYAPAEAHGPINFTWGTLALYEAPETVKAMHRRYVDAGADILLTNTFMFHR